MNNKDKLQRFIFENASVRGEIVNLAESYQTIMQQHHYPKVIQQILGEMLTVASLLSASIKFKGRVTVQFQGKGKLKFLLAQCNHDLDIRGLAQYKESLDATELMNELKQGLLAIIMDPEVENGQRYQGLVEWHGNSLAESMEGYFKNSEQIPTRLWLAVDEKSAAGLLIQKLPRESARLKKSTEEQDWEHISILSDTVTAKELLDIDHVTLLRRLYAEDDVRVLESKPVHFRCTCSVTRSENALRLLGQDEVEQELHEKQKIIVTCEFCNKEFEFDRVDVTRIFKQGNKGSSTQVH
ncbi:MAG: Hsp33 family molecular chaperone HslO [Gammaproteobacteria bacterium]